MEVFLTVGYEFYPDCPRVNELGQTVEDIHVAIHTTMEAAKSAVEEIYVKEQLADEEAYKEWHKLSEITPEERAEWTADTLEFARKQWIERDGKAWWSADPSPEYLIRKITVEG
jgi:hypothetical protein